jgi:hypothetical protein
MGFDLYGLDPSGGKREFPDSDTLSEGEYKKAAIEYWKWQDEAPGAYFRNNCWWWRPLWEYACDQCQDILTEVERSYGGDNSGSIIPAEKARKVGLRLTHLVEQGKAKEFEEKWKKDLEELPDEPCDLCNGTGTRTDMLCDNGCNKCGGKGHVRPFQTWYPFSAENVEEFAKFCINSGGFEIC